MSRKNGPTEVSFLKSDDTDRAKSGSLLQKVTSKNFVVTAQTANSRAKKQNYSDAENRLAKSKIRGSPLLPLSGYTLSKSGENQNHDSGKNSTSEIGRNPNPKTGRNPNSEMGEETFFGGPTLPLSRDTVSKSGKNKIPKWVRKHFLGALH